MERYQILEYEFICSWGSEEGFLVTEAFEREDRKMLLAPGK